MLFWNLPHVRSADEKMFGEWKDKTIWEQTSLKLASNMPSGDTKTRLQFWYWIMSNVTNMIFISPLKLLHAQLLWQFNNIFVRAHKQVIKFLKFIKKLHKNSFPLVTQFRRNDLKQQQLLTCFLISAMEILTHNVRNAKASNMKSVLIRFPRKSKGKMIHMTFSPVTPPWNVKQK